MIDKPQRIELLRDNCMKNFQASYSLRSCFATLDQSVDQVLDTITLETKWTVAMTIKVKVAEAKTHLSELLTKMEAGEDVVISRGNNAVARMIKIDDRSQRLDAIRALRSERAERAGATAAEIQAWRREGQR
nr:type II toxin-antitoxin system Phd/YefM family antitoxin [Rhizobium laguerreae]